MSGDKLKASEKSYQKARAMQALKTAWRPPDALVSDARNGGPQADREVGRPAQRVEYPPFVDERTAYDLQRRMIHLLRKVGEMAKNEKDRKAKKGKKVRTVTCH